MAEITEPVLDPERQASLFIPPFPKHLQTPEAYMKYYGWKPMNQELGGAFIARKHFGLVSEPEERAFSEMMRRSEMFDLEREAWVKTHSANFLNRLNQELQPQLGSLFQPAQPANIPSAPNLSLEGSASLLQQSRPPLAMTLPLGGGNSPFGDRYQQRAPALEQPPSPLMLSMQPTAAPPTLGLTGPIQAPLQGQPAMLGSVPVDERIASLFQNPQIAQMRIDPAHALSLIAAAGQHQVANPPTTPEEQSIILGSPVEGTIRQPVLLQAGRQREKQLEIIGKLQESKDALERAHSKRRQILTDLTETPVGSEKAQLLQRELKDIEENITKITTHQPSATQITNVNAFTPASEEAQRDFMKSTRTTYDQLKHAPVLLQNIDRAKELVPKAKGFMGTGGEPLLEAAKFLNNRLGTNINIAGIKSAEELRSRIFFNIMDNLKKMDAQPSQLQQQIMMDSLGKLGTDPNALPSVLDAYGDVVRGKVELHNLEVEGAVRRGVKFPYDPTIKLTPKMNPSGPWEKYQK